MAQQNLNTTSFEDALWCCMKVINWVCTRGEDSLCHCSELAENLKQAQSLKMEFDKFYPVAQVCVKLTKSYRHQFSIFAAVCSKGNTKVMKHWELKC